jgi:uncharacterized protein (TIGR02265 family)
VRDPGFSDGLLFEALFLRGVQVTPDLQTALLGIGVNLDQLEPRYPSPVWLASIDLARGYLYAGRLSVEDADRELGRKFLSGFLRSGSGRLLGAVLPFMTIERVLERLPQYVRLGRDDLEVEVTFIEPTLAKVAVTQPTEARPFFSAGLLEAGLDRLSRPHTITVEPGDDYSFSLIVRWTPDAR